jgi:SAM-dependent methyltransferase
VLDRAKIGSRSRVLDCGCGAGRFAGMAADRGASVAGIDAADGLIAIARERTPAGDFRVGDIESLPWQDDSFDLTTGFNAFQFAEDKTRALAEARRVSCGPVAVVIPTRARESGVTSVYKPLFPLFVPEDLETLKRRGIFALSEPGSLEKTLAAARLTAYEDNEIAFSIVFDDADDAERAFMGAGPTALAIQRSGERLVAEAVRSALTPLTGTDGRVTLPAWYRIVLARA